MLENILDLGIYLRCPMFFFNAWYISVTLDISSIFHLYSEGSSYFSDTRCVRGVREGNYANKSVIISVLF